MSETEWPKAGRCAQCGGEFQQYRSTNLYCKARECQTARQKVRWERWRDKQERDEFRARANRSQQVYRQRTGYARDWELRKKYGITLEEWLAMVEALDGKCEICGKDEEAMCVDHCHETGKVRGVLCRSCNRALGQLGDTIEHVRRVIAYLERDLP